MSGRETARRFCAKVCAILGLIRSAAHFHVRLMKDITKMVVEFVKADHSDSRQIESMLDDYLGELRNYREAAIGATSSANYQHLDAYWSELGRHIFLIQCSKRVVGFAFIRDPDSTESAAHQVAEFYVIPDSRRLGIGRSAVLVIWKLFHGKWELQVHTRNTAAVKFWVSCIDTETGDKTQLQEIKAGDGRHLQFNFRIR